MMYKKKEFKYRLEWLVHLTMCSGNQSYKRHCISFKPAFHDTDTDILARILARM